MQDTDNVAVDLSKCSTWEHGGWEVPVYVVVSVIIINQ